MVRLSRIEDLNRIMEIYVIAQQYMMDSGNKNQWPKGHPNRAMIERDITEEKSYVIVDDDGVIHGVFFYSLDADPTYNYIEGGNWHLDASYAVIHRIASDGVMPGIVRHAVEYLDQITSYIRIDTHEDNHTMQHVLEKLGFSKCGTIYLESGAPRIAFDRIK